MASGDSALFSAGTDATGAFSVGVRGLHTFGAIIFEEGNVTVADATGVLVLSGAATANVAFSFTVTAQDPFNNTVTSYAGTVKFTSTDGTATLPANSTLTNGTGTFNATLKVAGNLATTAR